MDELTKAQSEINAKISAILENETLNEEQVAEHDRLVALYESNEKKMDLKAQAEARDAKAKADAEKRADLTKRIQSQLPDRKTSIDNPDRNVKRTDNEGRVTAAFEETDETVEFRFGEHADAVRRLSYKQQKKANTQLLKTAGYVPWGEFKSMAEFVREGFSGNGHQAFNQRVHKHFAAVAGMSEGIGSDGGYTVMPEFSQRIIDRVFSNSLWGKTDNYTLTGNNITFLANAETSRATGSRHGGMRAYWLAEGGSTTASKPTLREVNLKLAKLGVIVYLTQELIDDGGAALQEYVARKASEEFSFMIGDAIINGTGVGQPLGVMNSPSLISIAKETGQSAATVVSENVLKMYARFFAQNLGRMTWYHNQDVSPQLNTMSLSAGATGGQLTYTPPGGLASSPYATLMGRPMEPTEFNATLGTTGDLIAADLSQMLSISKGGVAQAVSMHIQFLTDQLALRFIMRLNAGPWENAPITPYKGSSNTQSSFIALDTRA